MNEQRPPGDLTGRVIVVTGGAQGIGGATARLCAQRDAAVVIADWNTAVGAATAGELAAAGLCATFVQVDVRDPAAVQALMAQVQAAHGRLDVLICAAGIFRGAFQPPDELALEDFTAVMDVNVKGVFLCTKYAMPLFAAAGRGVVIIVGSGAGVSGPSGSLAYGASKGGANGYGMTLARHLAARNVRVNVLCPGEINTGMKLGVVAAEARLRGLPVDETVAQAKTRFGEPEGVARVLAFLASGEADYVRGTLFTR
jgi:NAD(P)-dependent dehydrogenase (short-subunit alcohol dehydrogenase family)